MTRAAAREGFDGYVDELVAVALDEFRVSRALRRGTVGPGARFVDRLVSRNELLRRRVLRPELTTYAGEVKDQFGVVLDVAAGDPFDAVADELLRRDGYYASLRSDLQASEREAARAAILDRHRRLAEAVEPLVSTSETAFWPAMRAAYDHDDAVSFLETAFSFTAPLRAFPDAYRFELVLDAGDVLGGPLSATLPSLRVNYTDEGMRVMRRAEETVHHRARRELDRRYADATDDRG